MDKDTEIRRLSPIAVLSSNGYIDLINGPQDHGWCFGYTCQERLSTFHALVALNQTFEVHMIRLFIFCIRKITIWGSHENCTGKMQNWNGNGQIMIILQNKDIRASKAVKTKWV